MFKHAILLVLALPFVHGATYPVYRRSIAHPRSNSEPALAPTRADRTHSYSGKGSGGDYTKTNEDVVERATSNSPQYIFSFGDSYTATNGEEGFVFTDPLPSVELPFGHVVTPNLTFTNGTTWIQCLVEDLLPPVTLAYNWGYPTATINRTLVHYPDNHTFQAFADQSFAFRQHYGRGRLASVNGEPTAGNDPNNPPWDATNSVATVFFGVNDIGLLVRYPTTEASLSTVMDEYFRQLRLLYISGVRKFVLIGAPPYDRSPSEAGQSTRLPTKRGILKWNQVLQRRAKTFEHNHWDARVAYVDTVGPWDAILDDPMAYGAPNNTCYDTDPNVVTKSCLWYNELHPSKELGSAIADAVYQAMVGLGCYA